MVEKDQIPAKPIHEGFEKSQTKPVRDTNPPPPPPPPVKKDPPPPPQKKD